MIFLSTPIFALPLLAGSSDDTGRVLIGVIVVVIWIIGAIVAASKKQQGTKSKSWEDILRDLAGAPPKQPSEPPPPPPPTPQRPRQMPPPRPTSAPRPLPPQRIPQTPSPAPLRPKVRPPRPKVRRQPSRLLTFAEPLADADSAPAAPLVAHASRDAIITAAATPAPTHARPATADADAIRRWMTPATLRTQFILTEILQPPLAMRDHDRPA